MSEENINLAAPIHAATKQGKAVAAMEVFMDGDQENLQQIGDKTHQLENAVKDIAVTGGASTANAVSYNNEISGMTAVTAQGAIDELVTKNKSQDAIIEAKAEKSDVQTSVSELKEKDSALSAELSKKANASDVTSKFTEESERVNVELAKKFNSENITQESGEAEDKVMSQKAVSDKLSDLDSRKVNSEKGKGLSSNDFTYILKKRVLDAIQPQDIKNIIDNKSDDFYVVDSLGNIVLKLGKEGLNTISAKSNNIFCGLYTDNDDTLYITDAKGFVVAKIDKNGYTDITSNNKEKKIALDDCKITIRKGRYSNKNYAFVEEKLDGWFYQNFYHQGILGDSALHLALSGTPKQIDNYYMGGCIQVEIELTDYIRLKTLSFWINETYGKRKYLSHNIQVFKDSNRVAYYDRWGGYGSSPCYGWTLFKMVNDNFYNITINKIVMTFSPYLSPDKVDLDIDLGSIICNDISKPYVMFDFDLNLSTMIKTSSSKAIADKLIKYNFPFMLHGKSEKCSFIYGNANSETTKVTDTYDGEYKEYYNNGIIGIAPYSGSANSSFSQVSSYSSLVDTFKDLRIKLQETTSFPVRVIGMANGSVETYWQEQAMYDAGFHGIRGGGLSYISCLNNRNKKYNFVGTTCQQYGTIKDEVTAEDVIKRSVDSLKSCIDNAIKFGFSIILFSHGFKTTEEFINMSNDNTRNLYSHYRIWDSLLDYIKLKVDENLLYVTSENDFVEQFKYI